MIHFPFVKKIVLCSHAQDRITERTIKKDEIIDDSYGWTYIPLDETSLEILKKNKGR